VDLVEYREYLIDLRKEALAWRFVAAPTHSDLPIFSRSVSQQFSSRAAALADARKHIDRLLHPR
jgi:hypothetical protein